MTPWTLRDTGDKLLLVGKSGVGSGLEEKEGSEGRFNLWEGKVKGHLTTTGILHAEPHDSLGRLRRVMCLHTYFNQI